MSTLNVQYEDEMKRMKVYYENEVEKRKDKEKKWKH